MPATGTLPPPQTAGPRGDFSKSPGQVCFSFAFRIFKLMTHRICLENFFHLYICAVHTSMEEQREPKLATKCCGFLSLTTGTNPAFAFPWHFELILLSKQQLFVASSSVVITTPPPSPRCECDCGDRLFPGIADGIPGPAGVHDARGSFPTLHPLPRHLTLDWTRHAAWA